VERRPIIRANEAFPTMHCPGERKQPKPLPPHVLAGAQRGSGLEGKGDHFPIKTEKGKRGGGNKDICCLYQRGGMRKGKKTQILERRGGE